MAEAQTIPEHVPAELVHAIDPETMGVFDTDPFVGLQQVRDLPPLFYNRGARHGVGSWTVTSAAMINEIMRKPDLFSSYGIAGFSQLLGENWPLVPLEIDPPLQTDFRRKMAHILSPAAVKGMEADIHALANELLDRLDGQRECDFLTAFGTPLPVTIFMRLMGLPLDKLPTFLKWEHDLLHSLEMEPRIQAAASIKVFLEDTIAARRAAPEDDLVSHFVSMEVNGQPVTHDQILGLAYLMFVGSLDTVAASLGYMFHYLATHPEDRRRLAADHGLIDGAIEELLRRYSVVTTRRLVTQDMEFHGVHLKQGDYVECDLSLSNTDPDQWTCPIDVDIERKPNPHVAFGIGPHRCFGSNLARAEMRIGIAEWLKRIPEFEIKPGAELHSHLGVKGLDALPIVW